MVMVAVASHAAGAAAAHACVPRSSSSACMRSEELLLALSMQATELASLAVFSFKKLPPKLQTFHHIKTLNTANDSCMEY